jgi:hypothetical protein
MDSGSVHGLQERESANNVVMVILERIAHGFANVGKGGKVDDSRDVVRAEYFFDASGVVQVSLHKMTSEHCLPMAIEEVVICDRVIAALQQELNGMAPNVACSPGY